jgi:hypothetical protein
VSRPDNGLHDEINSSDRAADSSMEYTHLKQVNAACDKFLGCADGRGVTGGSHPIKFMYAVNIMESMRINSLSSVLEFG